jgi:phospholipid-binding lipoprotein MlaA
MIADDTRAAGRRAVARISVWALALGLVACGPAQIPADINDPFEVQNRAVHRDNVILDKALVRPVAQGYGHLLPKPLRRGIAHLAGNLDTPRMVVDSLLQGRVEDAVHSTFRFLINSTVGIGGLFDPATGIGLEERDTDFGATLHAWGMPEGNYVELPVLGPSTDRDALGKVVDLALNPLGYVLKAPASHAGTVLGPLKKLDDRYTFGDTVDSVLYDSADGYAQARTLYLQHRRFELRKLAGQTSDAYIDPYGSDAGFADPYEDQSQ